MNPPPRKIKFLDPQQIREIVDGIPKTTESGLLYKTLIVVLFSTGLRISEALSLKTAWLKLDSTETQEFPITGKGGQTRPVYFSPDTLRMIKKYIEIRKRKSEYVFPIGVRAAQKYIKKWGEWAGFKGIRPHVFRHSFAVYVLSKESNLRICQELLGHRSITTTQIYTTITNKQLEKVHKEIFK
mgnify:FL=1